MLHTGAFIGKVNFQQAVLIQLRSNGAGHGVDHNLPGIGIQLINGDGVVLADDQIQSYIGEGFLRPVGVIGIINGEDVHNTVVPIGGIGAGISGFQLRPIYIGFGVIAGLHFGQRNGRGVFLGRCAAAFVFLDLADGRGSFHLRSG